MKNNTKIIPVFTYSNIDIDKSKIYKDNKGKSGIYRWNNKITNKSYVGSSINLGSRLSIYYSKKAMLGKVKSRTSIIYSALLKHDYSNFSLDILEYCEADVLVEREQYYLDLLKPEYNILKAANSRIGSKHSFNTRALMSLKLKGENHPSFGKTLSQEMRLKISERNKAFWLKVKNKRKIKTPETLLKMSLRTHGVNVKVLDKSNNLVNTFSTITSAAKHFGVSNNTMSRIENKGTYKNFTFKFEPKDFRVWVYDCNKNLIKIFNNSKETSKWCFIPNGTLHNYIKSGKLYNKNFYFSNSLNLANLQLNKESETTKIKAPITKQTLLKLSLRSQGVIVKLFDKKGNLLNIFPTITSAAKYFGVSNCTISCIPNKGLFKNLILKYEEKDTRVWIYDSNKKLVEVLNTTKETSKLYNIGRHTLNAYIRSGNLYKKGNLYFYKIKPK